MGEAIAARAGYTRPHDAVHDKAPWNIFKLFGHIFAQAAQLAAALGTVRAVGGQFDLDAGNVVWDWFALRLVGGCFLGKIKLGRQGGDGNLGHLQGQLQLLGRLGRWP